MKRTKLRPFEPFELVSFLIEEQKSNLVQSKKDNSLSTEQEAYHSGKLIAYQEMLGIILGEHDVIETIREKIKAKE